MANAKPDSNGRPTLICADSSDGITVVPIQANPTNHAIKYNDAHTGLDNGNNSDSAMLDENSVPVCTALSSAEDGSIVEVYADSATGSILIDSN